MVDGWIASFVCLLPLFAPCRIIQIQEPSKIVRSERKMVDHETHAVRIIVWVESKEELRPLEGGAVGSFHDKTFDVLISCKPELSVLRTCEC